MLQFQQTQNCGDLDSMSRPQRSVSRPERAKSAEQVRQVRPYPGFVPAGEGLQEERQQAPTSARVQYLREMRSDAASFRDRSFDLKHPENAHSSLPRGLSPRQGSASQASGGGRGRHSCNMFPWQSEENAILKSPREPTQSMSADSGGMPAGMFHESGSAAAALERAAVHAAGHKEPMERLQMATLRSDELVHPMEGSCVTPRSFVPPSRRPRDYRDSSRTRCQGSGNQSFSRIGSQSSPGKSSRKQDDFDDFSWPGPSSPGPELQLDLPGMRRARAASSGYSRTGPRRIARWRI